MRNLKSLWVVLQNEPVLVRTVVGAVLVAVSEFGLPVSDGQSAAIDALVVAVLALGARNRVTPIDPAPRPTILGKALHRILGKA